MRFKRETPVTGAVSGQFDGHQAAIAKDIAAFRERRKGGRQCGIGGIFKEPRLGVDFLRHQFGEQAVSDAGEPAR